MRAALLLALPFCLQAQAPSEEAAIRATVLDYVEGWYGGDAVRMARALHPELAKRIMRTGVDGRSVLSPMGAEQLVAATAAGGGKQTPPAEQQKDVVVLDSFGQAASARATMSGWVDYLHLAKWNGRWVIVNVLWEMKPKAPTGKG